MNFDLSEVVSKTPDFTGLPYDDVARYFAGKLSIDEKEAKEIMFFMVQWTLDNKDDLKIDQ